MKILHITNWYPTDEEPFRAIWISRHIDALRDHCENHVHHVEVQSGTFRLFLGKGLLGNKVLIVRIPISIWFIKEIISSLLVAYTLFLRLKLINYDAINFHIAYPLCTHIHLLRKIVKKPILITEHWSAYHNNFGVDKELVRIKRIFHSNIPLITVSNALRDDIVGFSENQSLKIFVVPNIVDTDTFRYRRNKRKNSTFLMVSHWKEPKDPFLILKTFIQLLKDRPETMLRIAGFGPQQEQIIDYINEKNLNRNISYLGALSAQQVSDEMTKAVAFLHCSKYETFSVVCVEALCCGTPVIASAVGGVKEIVEEFNGILVSENTEAYWLKALGSFVKSMDQYDPKVISRNAAMRFSTTKVGEEYLNVIARTIERAI